MITINGTEKKIKNDFIDYFNNDENLSLESKYNVLNRLTKSSNEMSESTLIRDSNDMLETYKNLDQKSICFKSKDISLQTSEMSKFHVNY